MSANTINDLVLLSKILIILSLIIQYCVLIFAIFTYEKNSKNNICSKKQFLLGLIPFIWIFLAIKSFAYRPLKIFFRNFYDIMQEKPKIKEKQGQRIQQFTGLKDKSDYIDNYIFEGEIYPVIDWNKVFSYSEGMVEVPEEIKLSNKTVKVVNKKEITKEKPEQKNKFENLF